MWSFIRLFCTKEEIMKVDAFITLNTTQHTLIGRIDLLFFSLCLWHTQLHVVMLKESKDIKNA